MNISVEEWNRIQILYDVQEPNIFKFLAKTHGHDGLMSCDECPLQITCKPITEYCERKGIIIDCEDIKYHFLVNGGVTVDNKRFSFGFSESVKQNDES